ncbi:MAG TPA: hypothetical protein VFI96_05595 [Longimicrobiaceae bacterium]|nr:hypothetical protein [Longimicrobiaceae bacterium]
MLTMEERASVLEQADQLWMRWDLHALNDMLSALPMEELLNEPQLGYRLASVLMLLHYYDRASAMIRAVRSHAESVGNDRICRRIMIVDADVCMLTGRLADAQKKCHLALEMASRSGDQATLSVANNNLGIIASICREWDEAIVGYTRGLIAAQRIGDASLIAAAYRNLALTYREMGFVRTAEANLEQEMEILRPLGSLRMIGSEVERAFLHHVAGDAALAEATIRRALASARSNDLPREVGECLRVLGIVLARDEPEDSLACFREAVPLAQAAQNPLLEAEVLEEWAVLEHRRNNAAEAADLATRSKEIYLSMGADRRADRVDERMA